MTGKKFDPAAWVERAEALGYCVAYAYGWRGRPDTGWKQTQGLYIAFPEGPTRDDGKGDLFFELRPDADAAERNERALCSWLVESGRIERHPLPDTSGGGQ